MIRKQIILFMVLLVVVFPAWVSPDPEHTLERKSVVIRGGHFGQGTMEVLEGVRILHLHGTPFEMGYQHGAMLRAELKLLREESLDYIQDYASKVYDVPGWLVRPFVRPMLYYWAWRFNRRIPEDFREEMRGLARGSGLFYNDVLLFNVIWEIGELHACSELALKAPAAREDKLWHGYTFDLIDLEQKFIDPYKAVIFYHPEGKQSFVSVNYIGMVGVYTGMNQSGVSIGWDNSRLNDSEKTLAELDKAYRVPEPFVFSIRRVMEESENLEGAVELISSLRRPLGDIVIIASRNDMRAVALETFSTRRFIREMERGAVFSANCFGSAEMGRFDHGRGKLYEWNQGLIPEDDPGLLAKSYSRHVRYAELIRDKSGTIGLEEMVEILRDPHPGEAEGFDYHGERMICSEKSNFSVIYNLTDNLFWVALGSTPAPLGEWVGTDFITEKPVARESWPELIPGLKFRD
jgi:hypothetical protein